MGNLNKSGLKKRLGQLCQVVLVACLMTACSGDEANTPSPLAPVAPVTKPSFVADPKIEMAPDVDTPLVGVLTLATNVSTRVSLEINTDSKNWSIDFNDYNTSHSLPVLGFRPNKMHSINVHIYDANGLQSTFESPLIVTTDPLPAGFPVITVQSDLTKMEPGYTLFNIIPEGVNNQNNIAALLVIVDEIGEVVWYHKGPRFSDHRKLPNGNLLYIQGALAVEMDMLGTRVKQWQAVDSSQPSPGNIGVATPSFHNEIFPAENGKFLVLSVEARMFDNYPSSETDSAAPTETAMVVGDVIVEFASSGIITNKWKLLSMLDPYRLGYESLGNYWDSFFGQVTRDWSHANALIQDPNDGAIIVSLRHQDALVKFNPQTGELIWILGPHDNWDLATFGQYLLTPVNDQPYFYSYHANAPEILPNGNIMLYDNGNYRASPPAPLLPTFSRAVEYSINEQNMTVELVWQYGQFENIRYFSSALGDADQLPNTGNVLITHSGLYNAVGKFQYSARVMEVTKTTPAEEVFTMTVTDLAADAEVGWRVYRSERLTSLYP